MACKSASHFDDEENRWYCEVTGDTCFYICLTQQDARGIITKVQTRYLRKELRSHDTVTGTPVVCIYDTTGIPSR
ncbi:hypothetical protein PAECIP111894_02103 [Paenibacillus pseudetheri]|uniref:Uncharacterized protein n=1 Tax=Paenibacillus pseudetheri TaxID=2897682 RepID=A0ABM9BBZ4_9BACL|nr:hypothetical protein PAECIP111894_02103 [Paenibacillus pseudetheri]